VKLLPRLPRPEGSHALSMTGRLFRGLVGPMIGLALLLGLGGAWAIHSIVEAVNDRLLGASARAVAETLEVEDGAITLDLPPWALGMLENTSRDNIYYNVFEGRRLITGYPDLHPPDPRALDVRQTHFRYAEYRGQSVRIAAEVRRLPRVENLVVVQVAETLDTRRTLASTMLLQLIALEVALIALASLLIPIGVRWGLAPLTRMRRGMDARKASDFTPLPLVDVPRELRDLVTAFNSLLARLDNAVEGVRRFTADASHQMRTPLSILRTHIAVLKQAPQGAGEARQSIADIEAAADRLQRLLIQLIALARAEGAEPSGIALEETDIGAAARGVAENYAIQALRAGVDLHFVCDESKAFLARTDDVLVTELLSNLVDNAVRYNHSGGAVSVHVLAVDNGVSIEVEDDGPGIPEEDRERVFTRFYRLHRDQERTGSGLGLSIVQVLAQILGVGITLGGGANGKGLNVRLHFPGARAVDAAPAMRDRLLTG
jgi:two-component system sensor histidine kinase TctE